MWASDIMLFKSFLERWAGLYPHLIRHGNAELWVVSR